MSKSSLTAQANDLRRRIAAGEADLDALRSKLAGIEAKLAGNPVPIVSGLDLLWKIALPTSRNRSSKQQCRIEWNKIPKTDRPPVQTLLDALKVWNRCDEWKRDGSAFAPGLHRWIKNRCWEDLPEVSTAPSRYRATPPKLTPPSNGETATPAEISAIFASLKTKHPSTPSTPSLP